MKNKPSLLRNPIKWVKSRIAETAEKSAMAAFEGLYREQGRCYFGCTYRGSLALIPDGVGVNVEEMRRVARNLALKSTQTKSLLRSGVNTVVDSGLRLRSTPDHEVP